MRERGPVQHFMPPPYGDNNRYQRQRPILRERRPEYEPRLYSIRYEDNGGVVMMPFNRDQLGGDEMAYDGRRPLHFSPNSYFDNDTSDEDSD